MAQRRREAAAELDIETATPIRHRETKTYQDGSRTYNPTLDAFSTPDRYGPDDGSQDLSIGTDPLTADTYNYVNGDPVNLKRPRFSAAGLSR